MRLVGQNPPFLLLGLFTWPTHQWNPGNNLLHLNLGWADGFVTLWADNITSAGRGPLRHAGMDQVVTKKAWLGAGTYC